MSGDVETVMHLILDDKTRDMAVVWAVEEWDEDPKGIRVLRTRDYTRYRYVVLVSKQMYEKSQRDNTFIILGQAIESLVSQVARLDDAEDR